MRSGREPGDVAGLDQEPSGAGGANAVQIRQRAGEASISIRDQQCCERYVAGRWYPALGVGQIAESGVG